MDTLSFDDFLTLSKSYKAIPLHKEIMADRMTPVLLFQRLQTKYPGSKTFLFESVEHGTTISRFSFAGCCPVESLITKNGKTWIETESEQNGVKGSFLTYPLDLSVSNDLHSKQSSPDSNILSGTYYEELTRFLSRYKAPILDGLPSFTGGLVGYASYDTIREVEDIGEKNVDDLNLPDAIWSFYDTVYAFDHVYQKLQLIHLVLLTGHESDQELRMAYENGLARLDELKDSLSGQGDPPGLPDDVPEIKNEVDESLQSSTSPEEFISMVEKAKKHIYEGDAFQIVLSQRFELPFSGSSLDLYRALRMINPSPYLFCLDVGPFQLIGSSPEILVQSKQGEITLLPIAGTRPRGKTTVEDAALERNLLEDEKEIAEHTMLIDLGRNDLSRVCSSGTVRLIRELTIERFSHVMHIVSEIKGTLMEGKTSADALRSCFPAGTVSGAPKIRAMQIIEELEPVRRGTYAGAVGYFDLTGNMDTCIAIRTICLLNGKAYIQAGAGIVADSDPQKEFEETRHKAGALIRAVEFARQIQTKD